MNCEAFESNVNDLARERLLDASVRARALAHRDECETCARRLVEESALSFGLRALASQTKTVAVPVPDNELFAALRKRQAPINATAVGSWRYWATAGVAVAAMMLLVIAVVAVRSRLIAPQTPGVSTLPNARPEKSIESTPQVVIDSKPTAEKSDNAVANHRTRGQRRNLKRQLLDTVASQSNKDIAAETATSDLDPATEITTEFMPIGYATETSMQDGGQLVRVELPRSALIAFGLPMNVNRFDERVKADVFFGADGLARAIRFVQ
ncbi:MAG TPA: hypothetical protein VGO68_09675 [Pyrinomonadaceae bacterium]|jgi:hypothetical protein|nr:hypothetical protein [Pyrinomonadaceae bacterium]